MWFCSLLRKLGLLIFGDLNVDVGLILGIVLCLFYQWDSFLVEIWIWGLIIPYSIEARARLLVLADIFWMEPVVGSNQNKTLGDGMSTDPLDDFVLPDPFGEQEILPRIGEEYQAQIPELVDRSSYISYITIPEMRLPVPLMVITWDGEFVKPEDLKVPKSEGSRLDESETLRRIQNHFGHESSEFKTIPSEVKMENGTALGGSSAEVTSETKFRVPREGCFLVPGLASESWSDTEKASFLLGLYIFEKNFVLVTRFMEGKKMGSILPFYYGKFFRSPEFYRWSECRKTRSRRGVVYGQKLFTGMRLQELVSRILPSISEKCKQTLLEVSKIFGEGKMSFEDYVFSLKAMVGINALVEAVGIGKGKQDLTGMALEPLRSSHVIPMRPEIPTGKACSSLTAIEIVKFLTGDYRLSKARSNDLFWEAVWPRLLARGWHSEEPKDHVYAVGSKNSLVFLIPGIKKFSRRRLIRGNHYFDSVTDVLSKVASEPGLIELELDNEEDQSKKNKEESEWNDEKLEEDDTPSRRRQYLQPRTPNRTSDGMKFTVVDTSLGDGKPYKVRELRSLPFEIPYKFNSRTCIEVGDDEDTSDYSTDDGSDAVGIGLPDKTENDEAKALNNLPNGKLVCGGTTTLEVSPAGQDVHMDCPNSDGIQVNDSITHSPSPADKQSKKVAKQQLKRRMKEDNLDNIAPVAKRPRRFTACGRREISNAVRNPSVPVPRPEPEMPICSLARNARDISPPQGVSSQDKLSLTNSSRSSPSGSFECAPLDNSHGVAEPQDAPQSQPLIDLNIPQVPLEFENDVVMGDATGESDDKSKNVGNNDVSHASLDASSSEQQSSINPQRRSTRNRPLTTKALEALANGFLTVSSRRKKTRDEIPRESRSSRLARVGVVITEASSNSIDSVAEGSENSATADKDKTTSSEIQALPEENAPTSSGP